MYDKLMQEPFALSKQLRSRRLELGLTQGELARRADTSVPTVSRYETGWTRFELATLRKLATALGCELVVRLEPKDRPARRPTADEVVERLGRLFWDTPLAVEHLERNTRWVVERVLELGTLPDVRALEGFLGRRTFLEQVSRARFSTARTREFWGRMLDKEDVPCTTRFSRREAATFWQSSSP
jgi:transcriptional regulator with XRE-family HTH domain